MRVVMFTIFICLIFSAIWLSMTNANNIMVIELLDYHLEISIVIASVILFSTFLIFFLISYFFIYIQKIPTFLKRYYRERQDDQDIEFLLEGFATIYQKDIDKNKNILRKVHNHSNDPQLQLYKPILALFVAESYKMQYEQDKSYNDKLEDAYMTLIQFDEMKLIALKGFIDLRVENKRYYDALIYAEKASAIDSKQQWLIEILLVIYRELGMYEKTDYILNKALNYKYLSKQEVNVLLMQNMLAHANSLIANSEVDEAIDLLEKVLKMDPTCFDAIYTLVELYPETNKLSYKIIEKAWKVNPSRELSDLLYNKSKHESLSKRAKLFENMIDVNTNSKEGYIILAKLYLEEKLYEQAKKVLERLLSLHAPDNDSVKLMALVEAKLHSNHNVIISWLNKL